MAVQYTYILWRATVRNHLIAVCCLLHCLSLTAQYRGGDGRGAASQDTEQTTVAGEPSSGLYGGGTGTGNSQSDSEEARPALPLELLHFGAVAREEVVHLQWLTVDEVGMDRFSVERSADGQQFTGIGELSALGGAGREQHYDLADPSPVPGENYYRLRSVNLDGTSTLSEVRRVAFNQPNRAFTIYPNPARKAGFHLSLTGTPATATPVTVSVTTITGRVVFERVLPSGMRQDYLITPTSWSAGTYIVSVQPEGKPGLSEKLVVFE